MTAKDRKRIRDLFSRMGSSSKDESDTARRKLDALLQRLGKTWNDLPELLQPDTPSSGSTSTADPRDVNEPHPFDDASYTPASIVHDILEQYMALQPNEYVAVALWAIHTHVYDRFAETPRLFLTSPVRGCGKSLLLKVLNRLVARPEKTDNITAAAIYDHAHRVKSTFLLDEADNLDLAAKAAMRAVLNAGHSWDGTIRRMVRGRSQPFKVFVPVALAAIGLLTLPLMSRSIVIHMVKHDGSRPLRRFQPSDTADLTSSIAIFAPGCSV
jgi:hypothetical protein